MTVADIISAMPVGAKPEETPIRLKILSECSDIDLLEFTGVMEEDGIVYLLLDLQDDLLDNEEE
jgi:hypothetical protein